MSSVSWRTSSRRSSRVSGVLLIASSSVTALYTRSLRSCGSSLKSSGPSLAMHAWCTAAFRSAYGSWTTSTVASATTPVGVRDRRSCRPISGPREGQHLLRLQLLLRRLDLRRDLLREGRETARELGARLREHGGLAAVDAELDGAVHRQLLPDLHLQPILYLARLEP